MLGAAGGAALVAGGVSAPSAADEVRIRVTRSFIWAREPVPVGHEMPMARRTARELQQAGKLEILPDPAPAAEPPAAQPELLAEPEPAATRRSPRKDPPA